MKIGKILALLMAGTLMLESAMPAYAADVKSNFESEVVIETDQHYDENVVLETDIEDENTSFSLNGSETALEPDTGNGAENNSEADYILGRKMTAEEIAAQKAMTPVLPEMKPLELQTDDLFAGLDIGAFDTFEEKYDLRETGVLTPIKNQNPYGTCWAFSTIALMESSLIRQGFADQTVDLSERHLAYFTYNTGYDALDNANNDAILQPEGDEIYYLNHGGTIDTAAMRLMNWQGAAAEADYPYMENPQNIARNEAQNIAAAARDIYFIPTQNAETEDEVYVIKSLLKEYGPIWWSYYHDDAYYNYDTAAFNCNEAKGINHAITIVGWDDTYSKNNFKEGCIPENDGAWIVRNSWDTWFGDEGYFYISYEDMTLGSGNNASVLIAGKADEYDNNYFHGNTAYYSMTGGSWKYAQIYEAKSGAEAEVIEAVSFMLSTSSEPFEIQIYKNPETNDEGIVTDPETGIPQYETPFSGETGYAGLYTVDVPPVAVNNQDVFSVVITFTDEDGAGMYVDGSREDSQYTTNVHDSRAGISFRRDIPYKYADGSLYCWDWKDLHQEWQVSARINVLTSDSEVGVPVVSCASTYPSDFTVPQTNTLTWTASEGAAEYEVYRSQEKTNGYEKIGETAADAVLTFEDEIPLAECGHDYYYKVKALLAESSKESIPVKVAWENHLNLPMSEVYVETQDDANEIFAKKVPGATLYEFEKKLQTEEEFTRLTVINVEETDSADTAVSYVDQLNGEKNVYEYRVRAVCGDFATSWSETVTAVRAWVTLKCEETNQGYEQQFKITWDSLQAAEGYQIRITRNAGEETLSYVHTVEGNASNAIISTELLKKMNHDDPADLGVGEEFTFKVLPLGNDSEVLNESLYTEVKAVWTPMAVKEVSSIYSRNKLKFSFKGAKDTAFIEVYKNTENVKPEEIYHRIDLAEQTTFIDTDIDPETPVYYWFRSGVANKAGETLYGEVLPYTFNNNPNVGIVILYEDMPAEELAVAFKKGEKVTLSMDAFDAQGVQAENPRVKWSASNAAVASVKPRQNGDVEITLKKAGQCMIYCSWGEYKEALLLKSVDVTPIVEKKLLKLETKAVSEDGCKLSENFDLTSVYGTIYGVPVITQVKQGKNEADASQFSVIAQEDGSYRLAVKEKFASELKNNAKFTITLRAAVAELKENVSFSEIEFKLTLQAVAKEPSVTVKEAGSINRFYSSGEGLNTLLNLKTSEKVTDVKISMTPGNEEFASAFEVIKDVTNGQWYLKFKNPEGYTKNSIRGTLSVTLEGYETIEKKITVKTPEKKTVITQTSVPVIRLLDAAEENHTEITLWNKTEKKSFENFAIEQMNADSDKAVVQISDGKLILSLKPELSYSNNEKITVAVKVWKVDEKGNKIWKDAAEVKLQAKVSEQTPKIKLSESSITLNLQTPDETVCVPYTMDQQNVFFYDADSKNYIAANYFTVSLTDGGLLFSLNTTNDKLAKGKYKVRIENTVTNGEKASADIVVNILDKKPEIRIKTSGKLNLTTKSECTLAGKLTYKNTPVNAITDAAVLEDDRFTVRITEKGTLALEVTETGMKEGAIQTGTQNVNLQLTLPGGTKVNTAMQIKPVCKFPKLQLPSVKTLYKSVNHHTVVYDLGEKLEKGAAIRNMEVVSYPVGIIPSIDGDILSISLSRIGKGLKSGTYKIKLKLFFEGYPEASQTKTISVKVAE